MAVELVRKHRVRVDFSSFTLAAPGAFDEFQPEPQFGGLVRCRPTALVIMTGIAMGRATVSVEALDTALEGLPEPHWEDAVEVSVEAPELTLMGHMDEDPVTLPPREGPTRVRVLARGRGRDMDGLDPDGHEQYLLQLWPAPWADALVLRMNSTAATAWDLAYRRCPPRTSEGARSDFVQAIPTRGEIVETEPTESEKARNIRLMIERDTP
jgi:hypothetical protein